MENEAVFYNEPNEETSAEGFFDSNVLLSKLNRVFQARKKCQGDVSLSTNRIRPAKTEERFLKRISHSTGYSEDQISYYFFHIGLKKVTVFDGDYRSA